MFFVTVTKREQQVTLPGVDCTVFRRGTWNIMLGASSNNTQVTVQGNGFSLVESPLAGVSPSPAASVALTADASELQVTKPLFSGRPIYFHQNPAGDFFCGTHMAALRACGVRLEADDAALPEYLLYRYLVPPSTLYKSVGQLPLGARLRVRLTPGRSEMDEIEYWSAPKPSSSPPPRNLARRWSAA